MSKKMCFNTVQKTSILSPRLISIARFSQQSPLGMFSAAKFRETGGKTLSKFAKLCFATVSKMRELILLEKASQNSTEV